MLNLLFSSFWLKLKLLFRHKAVSIRSQLTKWLLVNKHSHLRLPIDFPCIRRRQDSQRFTGAITLWEPLTWRWAPVWGPLGSLGKVIPLSQHPNKDLVQWWTTSGRAAARNVFAAFLAGQDSVLWMYLLSAVDGGWHLQWLVISSGEPQSLWDLQIKSEAAKVAQSINLWQD